MITPYKMSLLIIAASIKKTYSVTGLGWIWEDEVGKVNRVMCCSDHLDSQGPPYLIHLLPSMRQYDEPGDDEGRDDGEDRDDDGDHEEDSDNSHT